jgi:predicted permease
MNLREAWRLSRTPYIELVFRSAVMTRGTMGGLGFGSPARRVKSITRGALVGKMIITAFISLGAVFAFYQFAISRTAAALVTGVTLSLAISLGYTVLYSLQVLPSFTGAGPYALLSTLPLGRKDLSQLALFSVIRTFDSMIVAAVVVQVAVVAYLTLSPLATIAMALASVANSIFGITVSLGLAGLFQRNITGGGRGKKATVSRFLFLISWGLAAASFGFVFSLIQYIFPALESAISGSLSTTSVPILFSVLHPFSAGLALATLVFPTLASASPTLGLATTLSFVAMAGYLLLAYFAGRKALSITERVSQQQAATIVRQRATEFLLKLRRPIPAYVVKDARIASKNPSTAFVFALPVFETIIIVFSLSQADTLGATAILAVTSLGCFFTLISASILLNTEGSGLDYTFSLPLNARLIILAKSVISTAAYLPVPAAIGVLLALSLPSALWLVVIPVIQILAVSAASSAELAFFIRSYKKKGGSQTSRGVQTRGLNLMSAGDLARLLGALVVAGGIALGPLGVYAVTSFVTQSNGLAVGSQALVALIELAAVQLYLRRM